MNTIKPKYYDRVTPEGHPDEMPEPRRTTRPAEQQETTAEHSPLPWEIGEDGDVFSESYCVAKVVGAPDETPQGKANAAYIVKACNEYPKLLAALEETRDMLIAYQRDFPNHFSDLDARYNATSIIKRGYDVIQEARAQ